MTPFPSASSGQAAQDDIVFLFVMLTKLIIFAGAKLLKISEKTKESLVI